MSAIKPAFPGYPRPAKRGNPALAAVLLSANKSITTNAKLTGLAAFALDGFILVNDVLLCLVPGIYEVDLTVACSPGTITDVMYVGYAINGGTSIFPIQLMTNTGTTNVPASSYGKVLVPLGYQYTLEFRAQRTGGGTMTVFAHTTFNVKQVSAFQ